MQAEHALLMLADWPVGAARAGRRPSGASHGRHPRHRSRWRPVLRSRRRQRALVPKAPDTRSALLSIALGLSNFRHSRTVELATRTSNPLPATWCCAAEVPESRGTGSDRSAEAAPGDDIAKPPQPRGEVVAVGAEPVETRHQPHASAPFLPRFPRRGPGGTGSPSSPDSLHTRRAPIPLSSQMSSRMPHRQPAICRVGGFGFSFRTASGAN